MQKNTNQLWEACLAIIKDNVHNAAFEAWFKPIVPLSYSDGTFTVQVPSYFFYEYLEANYVKVLEMTLNRVFGANTMLKYRILVGGKEAGNGDVTIKGEGPKDVNSASANLSDNSKAPGPFKVASQDINSLLNPRYSFANFIEGESNRLVRAVSEQIALDPGKTAFNPLFIYGPSGTGKTHICQAIGLKIKELYPQKRVMYISSHMFRLQYTDAQRKNILNDFLGFYQSIDVLLLDDIHELIGMTKTQETFFQIFNNLHQLGRQLVVTCDRAPVDLQGMEERLISRLKWGMIAQLGRPEIELRRKILTRKIEAEGLTIPEEVFEFIVNTVTTNIRDLEGVIVSMYATSVHTNHEIDIELAKKVIGQTVRLEKKQLTIKSIATTVCKYHNLDESLIYTRTRKHEIVQARQLIMYFAKKYTDASTSQIGQMLGGKNHATVIYSIKLVSEQMEVNKSLRSTIELIELKLRAA
jgi:chromosomal replication initiator protein